MGFERELQAALEAARTAGERIRSDYERFVPIPDAPATISTETDRASQELILQCLHAAFPDDSLCAEEATATLASAPKGGRRVWVVDPIDGTRGFAMKNGEFSVMIGLVVDGAVVVGVVLEPALDRLTFAAQGQGCRVIEKGRGERVCRVTATPHIENATLVQSHAKPGTRWAGQDLLQPRRIVETYSAGVKLAMVARGEVDLYLNTYRNFADWDICAGHLLVTEAGGVITEIAGTPIQYGKPNFAQRGGLLATNGVLHADTVERLKKLVWS